MSAVSYGEAIADFQHARTSTLPFEDVLIQLRHAIKAAGLWVLHEIDPQKVLQRGGHAIGPARQILFFHPDLMVRFLQANQAALLEAPLKLAVLQQPDGAVTIRWIDPVAASTQEGEAPCRSHAST